MYVLALCYLEITIFPILQDDDADYFTYRDLNRTTVSLLLAKSLEDLVDRDKPQNVLKFKVICDYESDEDAVSTIFIFRNYFLLLQI